MTYKIKFSKEGSRKQVLDRRNDVFISKEQIKFLKEYSKGKNVSGVYVFLDKDEKIKK